MSESSQHVVQARRERPAQLLEQHRSLPVKKLCRLLYPDETTALTIDYSETDADALSRPDALKEGSTTLSSYRYLGSGTVVG